MDLVGMVGIDQSELSEGEKRAIFQQYFLIFPWDELPRSAVGADIGSGSGRWPPW